MVSKTEDELWDIYTKDREKTGRVHRRGDKMQEGEYHIVVHVCIFNSSNQLLIQKRQPFKKGWPNMWDLTAGGSALHGESSAQAAERETLEEVGVRIDLSDRRPNFTVNFPEGFDDYFLLEQDVDLERLQLQEEEVQSVRWVGLEEALVMQKQGTMIPYWFLDKLFEIRTMQGAHGYSKKNIRIGLAGVEQIASWMSLIEIVRTEDTGLETEKELIDYEDMVLKCMEGQCAICACRGNMVVGILLFSTQHNMLNSIVVHPDYRRRGIAGGMMEFMLSKLDRSRDISVITFPEGDDRGAALRALYRSMGFGPGELCNGNGYPAQLFVLHKMEMEL